MVWSTESGFVLQRTAPGVAIGAGEANAKIAIYFQGGSMQGHALRLQVLSVYSSPCRVSKCQMETLCTDWIHVIAF